MTLQETQLPAGPSDVDVQHPRPPRVLIVEDEALIALDIERRVRRLGYEHVGTADNCDDAVALYREKNPDLVLMDISIHGDVDGIDTARELGRLGDSPVIFITAYADDATVARAAEVSPYGYLQKPFDDRMLAVTAKVALARHASSRTNRVLSHIVSFASIGVIIVAVEGEHRPIVYVNDAFVRMSGQPRNRIIGNRPCFLASEPESDQSVRLMDAVARLTEASETVRGRSNDGRVFWTSVSVSPVVDPSGAIRHLVLLHLDVTEERAAQDTLAEMQRVELLGHFAASISHDFNNVVAVIQSFATLARDAVDSEPVRQDLDGILEATRSGTRLTRRLLDFAKGVGRDAAARADVTLVLRDSERLLRASAGENVNLEMRLAPHPMYVAMDPSAMEQVLLNLVVNARDAMPSGGRLSIQTQRPNEGHGALKAGQYAKVVVADAGSGMSPEVAEKVFTPFFTTKPKGVGTGLGLSTCQMLVQRAGGVIELESRPGEGTTFTLLLPLHEMAGGASDSVPLEGSRPGVHPGKVCVLVEADPPLRRAYGATLANAGFEVREVANETEAFAELDRCRDRSGILVVSIAEGLGDAPSILRHARRTAPGLKALVLCAPGQPLSGVDPDAKVLWHPVASQTLLGNALDLMSEEAEASMRPRAPRPEHSQPAAAGTPSQNGLVRPLAAPLMESTTPVRAPKALVVEDEEPIRRVWASALAEVGIDCAQAASAPEALSVLARAPIDVCITDLHLSGVTGFELLTAVRAHDPLTPVILVTGSPSIEKAQEAVRRQASSFLVKPVEPMEVVAEVQRVLRESEVARMQRSFLLARHGSDAVLADPAGTGARLDESLKGLHMHFQPIVQAYDGRIFGYEALMRSSGSMSNPKDILVAAEALGRLEQLSDKVRSLVASVLREHPERTEPIFVNLHPQDLDDNSLGGPNDPLLPFADRIVFEVTERAKINGKKDIAGRLEALRRSGFRIALDDLGEGYAGLSWLVRLLPDIAKLDMSLVRDVEGSRLRRELVGAIVSTCRRTGTLVVAEGVETASEARVLRDLGCDLLQGYHFGRPSPPFARVAADGEHAFTAA